MIYKMWKLVFAVLLVLDISAQDNVRYVMPSSSSPAFICPGQPCLTLGQFTEMADRYFTTGSTFAFLAGNHSLHTALSLTNVSNMILRGDQTANILVERNHTIQCENVSNIQIQGLNFVLCNFACKQESALYFTDSQVTISECEFHGSRNKRLVKVKSVYSRFSNITLLNCLFDGNTGSRGGAIEAKEGSTLTISGTIFTGNEAADSGGAVFAHTSVIILEGVPENTFSQNTCSSRGGALSCVNSTLMMIGNNTFEKNTIHHNYLNRLWVVGGGAVAIESGQLLLLSGSQTFSNSRGFHGGAILLMSLSNMSCAGKVMVFLENNNAWYGGALFITQSAVHATCDVNMFHNVARIDGGGVYIGPHPKAIIREIISAGNARISLSGHFTGNLAQCGGAVSLQNQTNVAMEQVSLINNSASAICVADSAVVFNAVKISSNTGRLGGGIYSLGSNLSFANYTLFEYNTALSGGALYLFQGTISFGGITVFAHNSAERDGGGIYAVSVALNLHESIKFLSNSALSGGGIYLNRAATMSWSVNTRFNSSFNKALSYGGGIYNVDNPTPIQCSYNEDTKYQELPHCFMLFNKTEESIFLQRKTTIVSNYDSAGVSGSFLYGGLLDRCLLDHLDQQAIKTSYRFLKVVQILRINPRMQQDNEVITSKPYHLCFCDGFSRSRCIRSLHREIHRGEAFNVPLFATAQGNSVISTSVTAITSSTASLDLLQTPQHLPRYCSNLTFNLYSNEGKEELILYPEGLCTDSGQDRVAVHLTLLPCPYGFFPVPDGQCLCDKRLRNYNVICEKFSFRKAAHMQFWMGTEYVNGSYEGLVLYDMCPVEYCTLDEVNMTLHDLDVQCAHGRRGVLCGGCAENYSLLVGSSKCEECSNTYLLLLLPFAAAGIALVAFLTILRLTVATGMINSLILYANIVQVNRKLFFPANTVNILTVFIAWLNLDLGIETCFYDGMDAFAQTCLQFAFPVYVWVLISFIILTSRYSITISKLIGHNPIAVLATLLLMSYTKVLNIIIEVYSSVKLDFPTEKAGGTNSVWLKDANVPYLQSKHLVLTVVSSLVLTFLFLPYTLLLLLGYKVYRFSRSKYFHWLNNLKPLLDSYYGPYKIRTRYWTGFLLLVRCILYVVFSFNSLGGTRNSLLAIYVTFTAAGFAMGFLIPGRVYKTPGVNVMESLAYFNLATLSAIALFQLSNRTAIIYSLVGMMFVIMMGVVVYHFHRVYLDKLKTWVKLRAVVSRFQKHKSTASPPTPSAMSSSQDPHKFVSRTVVELREPLLEKVM